MMPDVGRSKVLLVGNFLSGHIQTTSVMEELAQRLSGQGWPVQTTSDQVNRVSRLIDMLSVIWKERHQVQVAVVAVFSGTGFIWAEASCWALRRARIPYILNLEGGNLPSFALRWPRRTRYLLRSAVAVTTPSHYLADHLAYLCRKPPLVIPNAVELKSFPVREQRGPSMRIVWLRAFHELYSPWVVPRMLSELDGDLREVQVNMVGPDKGDGSKERMLALARQLEVERRINVLGPVPKNRVPEVLSHYDIFLNTTTAESFGVSVMEAAASGQCIVTTDVGEHRYLWRDDENALLVPPNNPKEMANAVRRIMSEPGVAERLSRNARKKAEQYDWSIVLPQWEQLLSEVAHQART